MICSWGDDRLGSSFDDFEDAFSFLVEIWAALVGAEQRHGPYAPRPPRKSSAQAARAKPQADTIPMRRPAAYSLQTIAQRAPYNMRRRISLLEAVGHL